MDFCKDCGGVLNLFGRNNSRLCSSCIQHAKTSSVAQTVVPQTEGWQLWISPGEKETTVADILKAARHIYRIRKKRQDKQKDTQKNKPKDKQ